MCLYDGFDVFCAAVGDFHTVSVDDFSESMSWWKMFVDECEEAAKLRKGFIVHSLPKDKALKWSG